jgi:hypothetical protein
MDASASTDRLDEIRKVMVEVVATKEGNIAMFEPIGLQADTLLRDQICERDGNLHDLVLVSHDVETRAAALNVLGLAAEVALGSAS